MKKCLKIRLENFFEDSLLIKLPIHPSTIEELALIRFWLLKLSQAHFEYMFAIRGILNPEFLSALNPRTGPRKILFHANYMHVDEEVIPADFAQFLCPRRIFIWTSLLDGPHQNNIFRFITGTGNTLEKARIFTIGSNKGEFCEEFFVKVSFSFFKKFLNFHKI
jgi:hypothetical protein